MINKALKTIRQFNSVTQVDLASRLGISKSYLSEIESGKKTVSYSLLEKYSSEFDIPVSSLAFLSETLSKKNPKKLSEKFGQKFSAKTLEIMEWFIESKKT